MELGGDSAFLSSSDSVVGSFLRGFVIVFLTVLSLPGDADGALRQPAANGDGERVGEMAPLGAAAAAAAAGAVAAGTLRASGDSGIVCDCLRGDDFRLRAVCASLLRSPCRLDGRLCQRASEPELETLPAGLDV